MIETRLCPFAFNQPVGNRMDCLEEKCMAWYANGDETGYCKLIAREE